MTNAGAFTIATFNLENLDFSPARAEEFELRAAALRPILVRLGADILCLQEIHARKTPGGPRRFVALERLLEGGPYADFHLALSHRPGGDEPADVHNLAIVSRWPILDRRQLHHDIVGAWRWTPPDENGGAAEPLEIRFDRPLLYAKIDAPFGALHVIDLHLRAPRPAPVATARGLGSARGRALGQFLAAQKGEAQALEARLFVDEIFDAEPEAMIAVCGDFNVDAHEAPSKILRGGREEDRPPDPRALTPIEERIAAAQRYSVVHAGRRTLIDHIFVSQALGRACSGAQIFNEGLADEAFAPDFVAGSLHAPVAATFSF